MRLDRLNLNNLNPKPSYVMTGGLRIVSARRLAGRVNPRAVVDAIALSD